MREPIPAGPFSEFLNMRYAAYSADETVASAVYALLDELGWDRDEIGAKRLYRMRKRLADSAITVDGRRVRITLEAAHFERAIVEDALQHAGVNFYDLYPEILDEVELEPDVFCVKCDEVTTPIAGICPWCETDVTSKPPAAPVVTLVEPVRDGARVRCVICAVPITGRANRVTCGPTCRQRFSRRERKDAA